MKYHSHYDQETAQKYGECPTPESITLRQDLIRRHRIKCIGEKWVKGYGMTAIWEGPKLDSKTQNLLCLKELENDEPT